MYPKNVEPVSPIKMDAGFRLYGMNPTQAPASAARMTAISVSPINSATASIVIEAMDETPTARPSRPSIRLTAFVMATIHRIVIGMDSAPRFQYSESENRNGLVNIAMRRSPKTTGIAAARI